MPSAVRPSDSWTRLRLDRQVVGKDTVGGVHLIAPDALVITGERDALHGLHNGPVLLQDGLELTHYLAQLVHIQEAFGLAQQPVELGIRAGRFV